ncbi:MAG: PEP-CTERM sorting domain-containing protein [Akkermansiaceae bacterium]|nr:PEP-CTERM sorting domain-containing protein [Akkermansiaceae bacterium]
MMKNPKTILTALALSLPLGAHAATFASYDAGANASGSYRHIATNETWLWVYTASDTHPGGTEWGDSEAYDGYSWTLTFDHAIDFNQLGAILPFVDLDQPDDYQGTMTVSGGTATTNTLSMNFVNGTTPVYNGGDGTWSVTLSGPSNNNVSTNLNGSTGTFTSLAFTMDPVAPNNGDLLAMRVFTQSGYELVPEPSSAVLMSLGGLALLMPRRRKSVA